MNLQIICTIVLIFARLTHASTVSWPMVCELCSPEDEQVFSPWGLSFSSRLVLCQWQKFKEKSEIVPGLLRPTLTTGTASFLLNVLAKASYKARPNKNWGNRTPLDWRNCKITLQRVQIEGKIKNLGHFCKKSIAYPNLLGPAV